MASGRVSIFKKKCHDFPEDGSAHHVKTFCHVSNFSAADTSPRLPKFLPSSRGIESPPQRASPPLVQRDDVRPTSRQSRAASHGAVALPQAGRGRRDHAVHAAAVGGADPTVGSHHDRSQGAHEMRGGPPILEKVAQGVLLVQGGDDGRAVMLQEEEKKHLLLFLFLFIV